MCLLGSYISRNKRGRGRWVPATVLEKGWKPRKADSVSLRSWQLKQKTPTRWFFPSFIRIFHPSLGWHTRLFYSNSYHYFEHPEWQMETLVPAGVYASSWYSGVTSQNLISDIAFPKPGCRNQWVRNWCSESVCCLMQWYPQLSQINCPLSPESITRWYRVIH